MKNGLTEQYSILIIITLESFEKKSYIRIDAELNGLQTGTKGFLAIDFSPIHIVKILKNGVNRRC